MSVINQMLQDLENRRSEFRTADNLHYQNLNISSKLPGVDNLDTILYAVLFGVILASMVLVFIKFNTGLVTNNSDLFAVTSEDKIISHKTMDNSTVTTMLNTENNYVQPKPASKTGPVNITVADSGANTRNQTSKSKSFTKEVNSKPSSTVEIDKPGVVHKRNRKISAESKADMLYQSAYEYLLAKNTLNAQDELRNALMIMPGHDKSRELLAGIYIKNARLAEARTLLQYGMRISPAHYIFAKLYARILMEQHDNVTAISVLLRNPPAQQTDPDYFALLAALYQKNKQHHEAAKLYSELLTIRNNYAVWWLGMAISLEALGNKKQAMLAYEKAKNSGGLSDGLVQYTDQRVVALDEIAYP